MSPSALRYTSLFRLQANHRLFDADQITSRMLPLGGVVALVQLAPSSSLYRAGSEKLPTSTNLSAVGLYATAKELELPVPIVHDVPSSVV